MIIYVCNHCEKQESIVGIRASRPPGWMSVRLNDREHFTKDATFQLCPPCTEKQLEFLKVTHD